MCKGMRNSCTAWRIVGPQSPLGFVLTSRGWLWGQAEGKTGSLLGESTGPQSMWILCWSHLGATIGEIGQNLPFGDFLGLGRCQVWVREAGEVLEIGADYAICSFWGKY